MSVTDKEQKKQQEASDPKAKKNKTLETILTLAVIAAVCAGLYIMSHHPFFIGKPHAVVLENITAIPGTTTMGDLAAAGYEFSDLDHATWAGAEGYQYTEVLDVSAELEARTYYDLVLVKNGTAYASIEVINEATSNKPFTECILREVTVGAFNEGSNNTSVDGVSFGQLSEAALSEATGLSPEKVGSKYLWKKGNYSLSLEVGDDGRIVGVSSKYEKE